MNRKRSLLAAAVTLSLSVAPFSSADLEVISGNDEIKLALSGQVNRGLLFVEDGETTDLHHVDNDASSTRFRILGEAVNSEQSTVGVALEMQFESNSSFDVNQRTKSDATEDQFTARRLEFYWQHERAGKLWVGQGWTASDGTSEQDLSGTALAGYSDPTIIAGGTIFRNKDGSFATDSGGGDLTVSDVFSNFDGLSRRDRLRYDTLNFGGFVFAASASEGDAWDVTLSHAADYGGTEIAAAVAYVDPVGSEDDDQVNGSLSVLFTGGISVTLASGTRDVESRSDDPLFYYGKLGYQADLIPAGRSFFSVDFHQSDDIAQDGDEAISFGLQAVQKIDAWATEAYVGYIMYDLDRPGTNLEEIHSVLAGARVKF